MWWVKCSQGNNVSIFTLFQSLALGTSTVLANMTYSLESHRVDSYRVNNCDFQVRLVGGIITRLTREKVFEKATRTFAVRVLLVDTGTVAAEALIYIDSAAYIL